VQLACLEFNAIRVTVTGGFPVAINNLRNCVICRQYVEYNWTYFMVQWSASGGKAPRLPPGLCLWTPLGYFRPPGTLNFAPPRK